MRKMAGLVNALEPVSSDRQAASSVPQCVDNAGKGESVDPSLPKDDEPSLDRPAFPQSKYTWKLSAALARPRVVSFHVLPASRRRGLSKMYVLQFARML